AVCRPSRAWKFAVARDPRADARGYRHAPLSGLSYSPLATLATTHLLTTHLLTTHLLTTHSPPPMASAQSSPPTYRSFAACSTPATDGRRPLPIRAAFWRCALSA